MTTYFLRRLLLVPVTFLVITFLGYTVLRIAPGGPIEQAERQLRAAAMGEGGGGGGGFGGAEGMALDEKAREELLIYYNLDQPIPIAYLQWLGAIPKKTRVSVGQEGRQTDPPYWIEIDAAWTNYRDLRDRWEDRQRQLKLRVIPGGLSRPLSTSDRSGDDEFWARVSDLEALAFPGRPQLEELLATRDMELVGLTIFLPISAQDIIRDEALAAAVQAREMAAAAFDDLQSLLAPRGYEANRIGTFYAVSRGYSGILQGDFGKSTTYSKPALDVIVSKFPISVYFGLIGYLASWIVCVPLGVFKAIHHRSTFDTASSILVFLGYATPGFVASLLLLLVFGGGSFWNLVPLGGFRSEGWDQWWANGEYLRCIGDQLHHTLVPIFGYLVGSFASMTVLMKNSLLENLGADYVRTAFAKGLPEKRVIFIHALRNSLIPITAGIGHFLGLLFAGSFLIEKVCNIPGMGLLGLDAILQRDYPIILATLVIGVLIRLSGNIFSDLIWALIDPRVRFR